MQYSHRLFVGSLVLVSLMGHSAFAGLENDPKVYCDGALMGVELSGGRQFKGRQLVQKIKQAISNSPHCQINSFVDENFKHTPVAFTDDKDGKRKIASAKFRQEKEKSSIEFNATGHSSKLVVDLENTVVVGNAPGIVCVRAENGEQSYGASFVLGANGSDGEGRAGIVLKSAEFAGTGVGDDEHPDRGMSISCNGFRKGAEFKVAETTMMATVKAPVEQVQRGNTRQSTAAEEATAEIIRGMLRFPIAILNFFGFGEE